MGLGRVVEFRADVVGAAEQEDELEEAVAKDHGDGDENFVAVEAKQAVFFEIGVVPLAFLGGDVRPQDPP